MPSSLVFALEQQRRENAARRRHRRLASRLATITAAVAALVVLISGAAAPPLARAGAGAPRAVIIVGPTHGVTSEYIASAKEIAATAENAGMSVQKIFHPRATWSNVKAAMQGANLVVYLGHGNGYPSPYTSSLEDDRQNGMGLNRVEGGSAADVRYYGADYIRDKVDLAPNAVVILHRLCYASGNGSPPDIPSRRVARKRIDNFSAGFLDAGARAVFAYGWQRPDIVIKKLMKSELTMDEIFMIKGAAAEPWAGFINWDDIRVASDRVSWSVNHVDPDPNDGYLRALSGDLGMTATEWRTGG